MWSVIIGFIHVLCGAITLYWGCLSIVCGILPKEKAEQVAYWQGQAFRELLYGSTKTKEDNK